LLRHGPPLRTGLLLGHVDEPALLDDCPIMRARVQPLTIRTIVASDLRRACGQAATLAQRREVPLRVDPEWRELDFGDWDGLAPETLAPHALAAFWNDPEASPPPGGERWSSLRARVTTALDRVDGDTLIVTHAGAMRAALSVLTGLDHRGVWALNLPYRALMSLQVWPGTPPSGQVTALVTTGP
jgi:alpha-ribazole phosphatase